MTSRSSSRSEGEVLSSDSEKATTSLPSRNSLKIDRPVRTASAPRSPAFAPRLSRSRSRSPYRASRGEKRRREDDYSRGHSRQDPRNFSVRYEDDRPDNPRRTHTPHGEPDHGRSRRNYLQYSDEDRQSHSKRPRTRSTSRSRSPYRRSRKDDTRAETRHEKRDVEHIDIHRDGTRDSRNGHGNRLAQSVSNRSSALAGAGCSQIGAKTLHNQTSLNLPTTTIEARKDNATHANQAESSVDPFSNAIPVKDEAAAIEERRKRREAIKNKYRTQPTSLLAQVLHVGTEVSSTASTPQPTDVLRRSISPIPSDTATPRESSGPQSPADILFGEDEDLANKDTRSTEDDAEEPSAADYDPTVDMQEERARHDKRLFKDEISTLMADEIALGQSTKLSALRQSSPPRTSKAEFDMFADDDDDDMFAEPSTKSDAAAELRNTAQALDVNMMDDWDDSEGYYNTILGELIESRYHVTANLGRGMFSSVVRATDNAAHQSVAIKIVRNNDTMRKAGTKEIDILKDIASNDLEDKKHVIRLQRSFDHKGHLCMVFENLSMNLREVLKKFGRDVGINLKAIRAYAQQLFLGLSLLKKCQYLHADLKPDNILVNEARNIIKICDLGSAAPVTENGTAQYLVSRFYRAPEIILGVPYDYAIDMWSIGCTLFELYTGKILFTGRNNNGMLRSIMECRGKFPHKLLRRGTLSHEYFDDLLNFQSQEQDKVTGRMVTKMIEIKAKPVRDLRSRLAPKGKKIDEPERKELEFFLDLLDKCLDLRPDKRITPNEALKHPFILRPKA